MALGAGGSRIVRSKQGIVLQVCSTKTNSHSAGTEFAIPKGRKPALCLVAMLDARLSDRSVALIEKRHVGHVGFTAEEFGGHSLRSGLATSAAVAGQSECAIIVKTRHKSVEMVRHYIQKAHSSRAMS